MTKLGFLVSHPTQFEAPFFQYISETFGKGLVRVYYFDWAEMKYSDPELGHEVDTTWGIDLLSDYKWKNIKRWKLHQVNEISKDHSYMIINGYTHMISIYLLIIRKLSGRQTGLRLDTVLWNNKLWYKQVYKYILLTTLRLFVDRFWVTGKLSCEYVEHFGVPASRITLFPYVVNNEWFRTESKVSHLFKDNRLTELNINKDQKIILCITKLIERESPIDLFQAMKLLKNEKYTLIVIGDGSQKKQLEEFVIENGLKKHIRFVGYIKYKELPGWYAIADLFVHTSINEPWGVSVQEAMACGLPVIASNFVGAGFDLIQEKKNGFQYKNGDIFDLAQKIKKVLLWKKEEIENVNLNVLHNWSYDRTWKVLVKHINKIESASAKYFEN